MAVCQSCIAVHVYVITYISNIASETAHPVLTKQHRNDTAMAFEERKKPLSWQQQ